jgi:hypothetical protein
MRSPSLVFLLLPLLLGAHAVPSLGPEGTAAAVHERQEQHPGGQHAAAAEGDEFYWKVGKFAVWVYCLHQGIKPVMELQRVVSASTRPARNGHGVDYLLVLRVAGLGTCEALVWGVPGEGSPEHVWKLKDFKSEA